MGNFLSYTQEEIKEAEEVVQTEQTIGGNSVPQAGYCAGTSQLFYAF